MSKCTFCEFEFAQQEGGFNEMWSVLDHLTDSHPEFGTREARQ